MDLMARRRWLLSGVTEANGWKKKSFAPSSDLLKGDVIVSAIKAELPQNYLYAIALRNTIGNLENYAFVGCTILPTSSNVTAVRKNYNNTVFQFMQTIDAPSYDARIRGDEQIDIYWRTQNITTDVPDTSWGYKTLQPGLMGNASQVKNALTGIGSWDVLISVADLDFNETPNVNNTYCRCIAIDSSNYTGMYERYRSGAYNTQSNWGSNYDLVIGNTTKLANFYLV